MWKEIVGASENSPGELPRGFPEGPEAAYMPRVPGKGQGFLGVDAYLGCHHTFAILLGANPGQDISLILC